MEKLRQELGTEFQVRDSGLHCRWIASRVRKNNSALEQHVCVGLELVEWRLEGLGRRGPRRRGPGLGQ